MDTGTIFVPRAAQKEAMKSVISYEESFDCDINKLTFAKGSIRSSIHKAWPLVIFHSPAHFCWILIFKSGVGNSNIVYFVWATIEEN